MADKSKILIIGGTGYIGRFIVEASAKAGHATFALVRESSLSEPAKGKIVDNFKSLGVTILHVCMLFRNIQSDMRLNLSGSYQKHYYNIYIIPVTYFSRLQKIILTLNRDISDKMNGAGRCERPRESGEGDQGSGCGDLRHWIDAFGSG